MIIDGSVGVGVWPSGAARDTTSAAISAARVPVRVRWPGPVGYQPNTAAIAGPLKFSDWIASPDFIR
jgi:hypothetical protein